MNEICFIVAGVPVGKGRHRSTTSGGKIHHYTPAKTVNYEHLVGYSARAAMRGAAIIPGAVLVELDIRLPIPKSWSKKKQQEALDGLIMPITKPDIDNVEKAIFDGLNNVLWHDDVQVVKVIKSKRYSNVAGVSVKVVPL